MFDRVLETPLFLLLPRTCATISPKMEVCLIFAFVENSYLFQVTTSRLFSFIIESAFQLQFFRVRKIFLATHQRAYHAQCGKIRHVTDPFLFDKNVLLFVNCPLFVNLQNLYRPILTFMACVGAEISSKELQTRRNFHEKSCEQIDELICRPHLSKYVLIVVSL